MNAPSYARILRWIGGLACVWTVAAWSADGTEQATGSARIQHVEFTGRVVCLPEEMHQQFEAELPTEHEHLLGFKTDTGHYYTLLRTRTSQALFTDPRLREKQLVVKGRVFPGTRVLEVTGALHSLKGGILHELYYYCDVCVINTIAPDPCLCCQAPVELKELPVDK